MLALPASVRVFFAMAPCDMRRGFDALEAMVHGSFGDDPLSGHLFVFRRCRAERGVGPWRMAVSKLTIAAR